MRWAAPLALVAALCLATPAERAGAQAAPGAPTGISLLAGAGSFTVSWSAPAVDGGSAITSYDLRHIETAATDKADENWTVVDSDWTSGDLSDTLAGLRDSTGYDVQVRAANALAGSWSDTSAGTTSDHGDTVSAATAITVGSEVPGRIHAAGDTDHFTFTLDGATYVLLEASTGAGTLSLTPTLYDDHGAEVYLYYLNESGWSVIDDGGLSMYALERLKAGTYTIRIAAAAAGQSGSYLLKPQIAAGQVTDEETCEGYSTAQSDPSTAQSDPSTAQSDPLYGCQWHLKNTQQYGTDGGGFDINVEQAWATTKGEGINVLVVDRGLDYLHSDLRGYEYESGDSNDDSLGHHDPQGSVRHPSATHGTYVAGVIAARDNDIGTRGVAPRATVYGYTISRGGTEIFNEARARRAAAASHMADVTAVSSNSWRIATRGAYVAATDEWRNAIESGITSGYGGKGVLYVWLAGNFDAYGSYANRDEMLVHHGVTVVCAVNYNDVRTTYSERGDNLWLCAPSGDPDRMLPGIATTALHNEYNLSFGGTSAATPIVSGVAALVRAANTALTWRDVKLILAGSARRNDASNTGWEQGALAYGSTTDRYWFNTEYGFGVVDAGAAVELATGWTKLPPFRERSASASPELAIPDPPEDGTAEAASSSVTLGPEVEFVEYASVELRFSHGHRDDIQVDLTSPAGTVSELFPAFESPNHRLGFRRSVEDLTYHLGASKHLGESAEGTWTLRVSDTANGLTGTLHSWTLTVHGHGQKPLAPGVTSASTGAGALTVAWTAPADTGGSDITSYDARSIRSDAMDKSDAEWTEHTGIWSAGDLEGEVTGLEDGVAYDVQLRAVNSGGGGLWSETVGGATASPPGEPRIASVVARDGGLGLTWTAPASDGGAAVDSYDARTILSSSTAEEKAGDWPEHIGIWTSTPGGDLRGTIAGLTNGDGYDVQLRAVNAVDPGSWSATSTGTPDLPADTSPTLVSNAGQSEDHSSTNRIDRSQTFTTSVGATLSSVEIISEDPEGDDATVSLCTVDGSDHPTSTCTVLTAPPSFAAGTLVFRAPANTTLAANTTYSLLIASPGGEWLLLDATESDNEDAGGATGWSIANTFDTETSSDTWVVSDWALRITIKGTLSSPTNSAPTVATEIPDQTAMSGTAFSYQVPAATFTDADSDTLTYAASLADDSALPAWLSFSAATRTFSGTPTAAETVSVKVTASDASDSVSDTFDIVVDLPADTSSTLVSNVGQSSTTANDSGRPRAQAFTTGAAGATLSSVEINYADADSREMAVSLCTTDSSGYPTSSCTALTAPVSFASGTLVFTDPASTTLAANTTYTLLITSPESPIQSINLNTTSSSAQDTGAAAGWTIADAYNFTNISNAWRTTTTGTSFLIAIKGTLSTNTAPTVATAILDQTATTGTALSFAFPADTFADAESDTLTYAATLADDTVLPSWLSFDPATRTFSGTPTAVETVSVKVTASDASDSVSDTFDIVVSAAVTGICSRTAEVQTALLDATSRTTCADVTAADLVAVTSLTVNNYSGTVLDPADFAGLTGLTNLLFGGSPQLTTVPDNAFAGVTALTLLDFNSLVTVTMFAEDAFSGLTALENLNLSGNDLTMLDEDTFDGLTALHTLDLSFTALTTLAADIFNGLTALEEIDLSFSSNMAALDEDTFDGLTALHTLDLSFTALTTLDADIFDGLTALEQVYLSGNRLTTLDADIFDGLTALSRLELQGNRLTALDADIFDGLTALEQVYLSANLLTTLDADIFDGLTLLQEISLDRNSLDTLDADIFDGLTALQKLQLQDNRLTALHADIFDGLTVLELLDLNCNYFTALDFDIFDPFAATLTSLDLRSDSFTTPPTDAAIRAKFTNIDTVFTGSWTCERVTVSPTSLTVTEGATGTLSVALRSQPSGDVALAISSDNLDVTVAPTTALTFTAANWDTAQTVTVSAAQDTDEAHEAATLILDPDGNDYDFVISTVLTVTVTDDDADTTAPRVASIVRQVPTSSPTNADSLTWRVTFSEAVSNVDAADFAVSGTTATVTAVAAVSGVTGAYDVTASGGNLASVSATVTLTISSSHNIADAASNALSNTTPTGTNDNSYVVDNTAPTVTISGVPSASNAPFTATLTFSEAVTGFAVGDITLTNASVSNFTATSMTVYTALVTPTASGTVTVNVPANAARDAAGNGNTAASLATTIYTPPAITITAGTSPVTEGTSAVFTLSRAGSTTAALTVNVTVSETGGDMVAAANEGARTVTFLANAATVTLSVATASDSVDEANSVVTATISADTGSPASYSVGTPASAMVTVEDNDTRDVTVSPTALPVNEGSTGTYTVVLNSQPTASVTVTPSRTGSSDVTFSPAPLTFTTSTWSMVQTVTVTAAQDSDAVDDSATISHAVTGGDYAAVTADSVVVTVDDDETADTTAPRVASITRQNPTVSPTNADSLTWRVTFSETVSNVNEADFVVSGTTATVTAVAAVSGVTGGYDVTASGGNLAGLSATVTLAISSSHNIEDGASNALSNTAPTGTNNNSYVVDNTAPTVTISGVPATSTAPFTATFTFSEAVPGFAASDITLTNATASSFTSTSTTVYTALVTPTAVGEVTVDVLANAARDNAGNVNTAATQASSTYTGTVALPAITIRAGASPVAEGTSAVFTLSRTGSTTAALTVNVTVSEAGGDMVAASNEGDRTVTFLANSTTVTLSIATVSDSVAEAHSVVTATISADTGSPASYSVAAPGSAMVTVQDDDSTITVPGAPTALSATAAGGTQINLSWTAPGENGGAPISGYKIEVSPDGNADWTELVANTGNANTTYEHIGLTVGTTRHYRVSAINSDGVGDPSNIDDATASVPTVTLRTQSVPESIGTAMLVVTLDQAAGNPLSVPWYTLSSTAASPGDYTNGAGTLIIPSGVTNATISITIIDDAVEELTETVLVLLSPGDGYELGGSGATVSILDDDGDGPAPSGATVDGATVVLTYNEPLDGASTPSSSAFVLRVAGNPVSINEVSVDGSEVTLTLASPVPAGRTVSLDYTQPMSNPIQDASGNKAQSFTRWYLVTESTITITNPVITVPGAPTALSATAVGNTQINLSWTAPGENGGAPISGYKIESSPDGVANWTELVANTGNANTTYEHLGLTFGTTRHYRVSAINSVGAGRPSNIDDAIASIPSLSLRTQSIPEGIGTAAVLVTLNQPAGDPLSVPWYTLNGDAVSPGDYTAGVGQLIIPPGATSATISITIIDDADEEPTETFLVLLSPGEGYVLGGSGATVSILDDDGDGPAPIRATVDGATVVLTYNEPLDGASTPSSSAFVLRVAGDPVSINEVSVDGSEVTLTLAAPVPAGQTVSLDYTQPMSNPIQDGSGNKAQSFTRWYLVTDSTITGTVDTTAPTVTISGVPAISDAPFTATFTFSEAVTGFAVGDITLGNATASSFTSTSTTVYRALVTPTAAGAVTVDVSANAAQDAAGNGNTAATRASSTYTGSATRGVTVFATVLIVTEGSTGTYTVVLDSQPTANVTVTPSRTGSSDVTFSPATLTFTALNWNTVQPVTVTAAQDSDAVDDSATISHAVTGGDYVGVTVESVVVRVNDDESVDTVPGVPTDLSASTGGDTRINLSWTAPGDDGGSPITGYKIEVAPDGNANWTELVTNTGNTTTTYAHIGLAVGTTRHYRVSAINAAGAGGPSNIDDATAEAITGPITTGGGGGGGGGPTPSEVEFEWTVDRDIEELDGGNDRATGVWSDGTTLWVADNADGAGDTVYAYDRETGERVEEREFELHETNRAPRGFWSDRSVVWVSDSGRERLFAYRLADGERLEEREFELPRENRDARGIWSDEKTMWVLDGRADALFAYDFESGALLGEYALDAANGDPRGIWSDRVTVWVSDHGAKRLFAYRLPALPDAETDSGDEDADDDARELERVRDEEFSKLSRAGNNSPRGLWSDGDVMYVADESDDRVYTYNMPDAIDARLASLSLSGVDIGEFDPGRPDYEAVVADGVTETTVEAGAMQPRTDVAIDPPDADGEADGHQVALQDLGEITVTVTSADGSRTKTYRVRLGEAGPSASCLRGAIAEGFSLVVYAGGSIEDLVACAGSRHATALYVLDGGEYVSFILGAPELVNEGFVALYADGIPALTPLIAKSEGPPSPAPESDDVPEFGPDCLRGEIETGFNLVLHEGGSIGDLEACADEVGLAAVYVLADGVWVSYILGAPELVNRSFRELFTDGLPAATPLVGKRDAP